MKKQLTFSAVIFLAALALAFSAPAPRARASSVIVVNSTRQSPGGKGNCTLGEAIRAANSDSPVDGCPAGSGADTIELANGATYTLTRADNSSCDGANGLPMINSDITINGRGSTITRSTASGTPGFRMFRVSSTGTLTLNQLTLSGGREQNGGAIRNEGTLSLTDTTLVNNFDAGNCGSIGGGAGIFNDLILLRDFALLRDFE